jgi:hypothetical protein
VSRELNLPVPEDPRVQHKLHCLADDCEYVATSYNRATALRRLRNHRNSKHPERKGLPLQ